MSTNNVLNELMFSQAVLHGSASHTDNLNDAGGVTITATVAGAAIGDFVLLSAAADLAGLILFGYVSVADTVSIRVQNETGGAITTDHTIYILVIPRKR